MRKTSLIIVLLLIVLSASAQRKFSVYAVGFYNLENLFDTCHDSGKNDYEFLPSGSYKWNALKYEHKLRNMARALADIATTTLPNVGCAAIGVSEVENARALSDLCAQEPLRKRGYRFAHVEGPDRRGVDCALLYQPSLFEVRNVKLVPYVPTERQDSSFKTRGFLTVSGTMAGEHVTIVVCHLPSRFAGPYFREVGAAQVRALKDSLLREDPACKVMVMGDMNDDPTDKSMHEVLGAKAEITEVGKDDMYNPWYNLLAKQGTGTLMYNGAWNLFDQIILSPNLLSPNGKKDFKELRFWRQEIQRMPYLFQTEGKYKGSPKRTTAGGVWLDGYSDHLPVCVYLVKEQR